MNTTLKGGYPAFLLIILLSVSVTGYANQTTDGPDLKTRVEAHPVSFSLHIAGEAYEFDVTIADGISAAVTSGKEGNDFAYRVEVATDGEKLAPGNIRFLPLSISVLREDRNGRTLLQDVSMGLKIGVTGSMEMGTTDELILVEATVGEPEEYWVSDRQLQEADACFKSTAPLYDQEGRRLSKDKSSFNIEKAEPDQSIEGVLPPNCCQVICSGTGGWFICCNVFSCCGCDCCYPAQEP